ncbi:MAG: maleylpyruvate isomerase family mycothiol-dependent enzyme [Actinomycetota bacterium]
MDQDLYLDVVRSESDRLVGVAMANLDTPIDFLPGWSERDLLHHIGAVWSMVIANIDNTSGQGIPFGDAGVAPDDSGLAAWLGERRSTLIAALEAADLDAQVWTFAGVLPARFWIRRMAHEIWMHRWDAQAAVGEADPVDGDLGADAVDEYADVSMRHSGRFPERVYPAETLHLHRTDGPGEWMFARGETENELVVTEEHGKGAAAVRASGSDLALWVRGRPVTDIEMFGDEAVAAAWQAVSP